MRIDLFYSISTKSLISIKDTFMAKAASLDKKITAYLTQLTTRQKKTLLTVAKTFAEEYQEDERWDDPAFINEIDKRFAEYESGKIKALTLDELETKVRQS